MVNKNLSKQRGGFGSCGSRVNTPPGVTSEPFVGGKRRKSRKGTKKKSSRKGSRRNLSSGKQKKKKRKSSKKKSKGSKSKLVAKKNCGDNLTNPDISALCMTCFHRSGKKTKQRVMAIPGRECRKTRRGRLMLKGKCIVCEGTMVKMIA